MQTSRPLCNGLVPHDGAVWGRRGEGDHLCPVEGEGEGGRRCLEKVNGGGDGSDDDGDGDGDDFPPRVGVGVGDRVAGYIPNCPEAIIAMAATAALGEFTFFFFIRITILSSSPPPSSSSSSGAVWSSTSPDFGVSGVLDRFSQIEPKVSKDYQSQDCHKNEMQMRNNIFYKKVIFSVEAVSYNMKTHNHMGKLAQVGKIFIKHVNLNLN